MFAPLIVLALWMGIYPATFLAPMEGAVEKVITIHKQKLAHSMEAAKHSVARTD